MASTRYENRLTGRIVTAWQYNGQILAPSDIKIPRFIWKAMDRLQVSRNHSDNLSIIGNNFIGFALKTDWVLDDLTVMTDEKFNVEFEFYA